MPIDTELNEAKTTSENPRPAAASSAKMELPSSSAVLFISPVRPDQAALRHILRRRHRAIPVATCRHALRRLNQARVPIVLCDGELPDGTWRDILNHIAASDDPPLLIVTSRTADNRLWAEVLNLGGFDVIAKPFNASEVLHVLSTAWAHRHRPARSIHFAGSM